MPLPGSAASAAEMVEGTRLIEPILAKFQEWRVRTDERIRKKRDKITEKGNRGR